MYRIIDGRGTGKTSRLMLLAKENNAIIACSNPKAMQEKAHAYGIIGIDFVGYNDILNHRIETKQPIYIDELEKFIKYINYNVNGYSLTNED